MRILKWGSVFLLIVVIFVLLWVNVRYNVVALNFNNDNDESQFRVLTWNIHSPEKNDIERQKKIAKLIIEQNADFVQLNEFTLDNCLVIDSILSKHYAFKEDVKAKRHAGDIFYSRIPLIESGKYKTGIKGKRARALKTKICVNGDTVFILGCHFTSNNYEGQIGMDDTDSLHRVNKFWERYQNAQENRKKNVSNMLKTILESRLPMILMGDLNDFNASEPMDSLKEAGMKNAWWEGGFGYGTTYHEGWLRLRIDHIYYNDRLKLESVKVIETKLSDHNPLVASFSLK